MRKEYKYKRIIDIILLLLLIPICIPLVILIALTLTLTVNGKIIFSQIRSGYQGIPFKLFKFKTMSDQKDAIGKLLPDEQRLTKIGKFLRKTSLDELPSLINIIKGQMSFVGPRPLLMEYLDKYTTEQKRRHDVMPGITGWGFDGRSLGNGPNRRSPPHSEILEIPPMPPKIPLPKARSSAYHVA